MLGKLFLHLPLFHANKTLFKAKSAIMPFYAVAKGRTAGIYMTWPDCESQVRGFPGAKYKKFNTVTEAQEFITTQGGNKSQKGNFSTVPKSRTSLPDHPATSNLKRNFNTSAQYNAYANEPAVPKKKSKTKRVSNRDSDNDSDESDDINAILVKQMDDIEKRLKGFEKGVDKIIKKSSKADRRAIMIEPQHSGRSNNINNFEVDDHGFVQVYTDGACSSNGRNGAKAGLGVYWGEGHPLNTSAPVSGRATNNCGEIQAATCAIRTAIDNGVDKLAINSDSKFLINSVTKWMHGWKQKGWKLRSGEPVKNEVDFKDLDSVQNKLQIKWNYVEAHRGVHGNEMADQLAKAGAAMYSK